MMSTLILALAAALAASDRSAPPEVTPADLVELPQAQVTELADGLRVHWVVLPGMSRVHVQVRLDTGAVRTFGARIPALGLADMLFGTATTTLDRGAMTDKTRRLDLDVNTHIDLLDASVSIDAPHAVWPEALDLASDLLHHSVWPAADLKLQKTNLIRTYTRSALHDTDAVANAALRFGWFPATHPLGTRLDLKGWQRASVRDLNDAFSKLLKPSGIDIFITGDVNPDAQGPAIAALFSDLAASGSETPVLPTPPERTHTQILAIDVPGATLASIRYRTAAPGYDSPERIAFLGAVHALGGSFLSRLNRNIREEKGWTYGVHAGWSPERPWGTWSVSLSVPADKADDAIAEITHELTTLQADGPTPAELHDWHTSRVRSFNDTLRTAEDANDTWESMFEMGWTERDYARQIRASAQVHASDVQAMASKWLRTDRALIVVAGDRTRLQDELAQTGLPITWLRADQAILGTADFPAP